MRIAVLTTGYDIPGTNAAIRMLVAVGVARRHELFGISGGFDGLMTGRIAPLGLAEVEGITRLGGSVLGGSTTDALNAADSRARMASVLTDNAIDGLVVVGGQETTEGCHRLADESDCGVVVVPASLDNDVAVTKACIGADSAARCVIGPLGPPSQSDRVLAIRLGFEAIVAVEQGATDVLLGWDVEDTGQPTEDSRVRRVPLGLVVRHPRKVIPLRMAG